MFEAKPHPYLVPDNESFRIASAPTAPDDDHGSKSWEEKLEEATKDLYDWQNRLYADGRYAVLFVFQATDAAGKDGTIRHVFDRVNPCGLRVASFKQPTRVELAHDFLWRTALELPRRGERKPGVHLQPVGRRELRHRDARVCRRFEPAAPSRRSGR